MPVPELESMTIRTVVSDTGPLLSVFQSGQLDLFRALYDAVYIPASAWPEYEQHGAGNLVGQLVDTGLIVACELSVSEQAMAWALAEEIALHPLTQDREPQSHYPEAEAMILAGRPELGALDILLDERAAREVAAAHGLPVLGFAGVLIQACRRGLTTPEAARASMFRCQSLGTHYATSFIEGIYRRLKEQVT